MAEFSTPKLKKLSLSDAPSVFMTPSSSCGRPVFPQPPRALLTPLPISFPSPAPTPPLARQEHKDIITALFREGFFPVIAERIISYLRQDDISKCLLVSRSWKELISPYRPKRLTLTTDIEPNLIGELFDPKLFPTPRQPLKIINNRKRSCRPESSKPPLIDGPVKMRPCPNCCSPAKVLNNRRAECTKCTFDFCRDCSRSWHEEASCGIQCIPTSPKKNDALIAGTKKSKKRLKRL